MWRTCCGMVLAVPLFTNLDLVLRRLYWNNNDTFSNIGGIFFLLFCLTEKRNLRFALRTIGQFIWYFVILILENLQNSKISKERSIKLWTKTQSGVMSIVVGFNWWNCTPNEYWIGWVVSLLVTGAPPRGSHRRVVKTTPVPARDSLGTDWLSPNRPTFAEAVNWVKVRCRSDL